MLESIGGMQFLGWLIGWFKEVKGSISPFRLGLRKIVPHYEAVKDLGGIWFMTKVPLVAKGLSDPLLLFKQPHIVLEDGKSPRNHPHHFKGVIGWDAHPPNSHHQDHDNIYIYWRATARAADLFLTLAGKLAFAVPDRLKLLRVIAVIELQVCPSKVGLFLVWHTKHRSIGSFLGNAHSCRNDSRQMLRIVWFYDQEMYRLGNTQTQEA